jgi:hypothetical protein
MTYVQAVYDIINMVYLCKSEDACDLAALQAHARYGDYDETKSMNILNDEIESYIPARVFDTLDRTTVIRTVAQRYSELVGYTALEAKIEYLDIAREIPSFGSSYFLVFNGSQKTGKEQVVSITPKGVFLIDNYTKEVNEEYPFDVILTWGQSQTQFVLAIGIGANKKTLSFKCNPGKGKEMSDLMTVYSKEYKKNKHSKKK